MKGSNLDKNFGICNIIFAILTIFHLTTNYFVRRNIQLAAFYKQSGWKNWTLQFDDKICVPLKMKFSSQKKSRQMKVVENIKYDITQTSRLVQVWEEY